jgi:hypothetical protein
MPNDDAALDGDKLMPVIEQMVAAALARQPSVIAALRAVFELAEVNQSIPGAAYNVLVVPDTGDLIDRVFVTAQEAADFLATYVGGPPVRVRAHYGRRCMITRPPAQYLLTHEGRFPLFDAETSAEVDPDGSLAPFHPTPPPAPPVVDPPDDDPEDEDDGEDGNDD